MTALRIALYDDDSEFRQQMVNDVEDAAKDNRVSVSAIESVKEQDVTALRQRQEAFREGQEPDFDEESIFDQADLFIVDYDLQSELGASATGEGLAYLVRCFSTCGPIIEVNQYGRRSRFDLRLVPEDDSWAELNIAEEDLGREGLWDAGKTCNPDEFRPWYWPVLPRLVDDFRACVEQVGAQATEESPMQLIGFDVVDHGPLPDRAIDFFEGDTLLEAVGRHLEPRDQADGPSASLQKYPDQIRAAIIASRVRFWTEHLILPTQARIIDLPHLSSAFPHIVGSDDIEHWNATTRLDPGFNAEEVGDVASANEARLPSDHWVSRPAWFLEPILDNNLFESEDSGELPYVFLEDSSCFAPLDKSTGFRANAPGPKANRFIRRHDPIDYEPSNRLRG